MGRPFSDTLQNRLIVRDNDMHLRRTRNCSDAILAGDYVTKRQLDAVEKKIVPGLIQTSSSSATPVNDDYYVTQDGVKVTY